MNIPGFRFDEIDFSKVQGLTWYDLDYKKFDVAEEYENLSLPPGALLKTPDGLVRIVGDVGTDGWYIGCGCCADEVKFTQIAFLSEVLT